MSNLFMDLRLTHEQPTPENTLPVLEYRAFSPERFSVEDEDKHVVYSGGSGYLVTVMKNDPTTTISINPAIVPIFQEQVDLYVLNSCLLLWSATHKFGVEVPYQKIVLHALQHQQDQDVLYLQLRPGEQLNAKTESDYEPYIEITIKSLEPHLGLAICPPGTDTIPAIYDGMAQCSALHADEDESTEEDNGNELATDIILNQLVLSSADDLDIDLEADSAEHPVVAGMSVDVGYASIAGRRKRDDQDNHPAKRRL